MSRRERVDFEGNGIVKWELKNKKPSVRTGPFKLFLIFRADDLTFGVLR
jgi:hypothetical protein